MSNRHETTDSALTDLLGTEIHPEAAALIAALADCRHPRAPRLAARLADAPDHEALAALRGEVLNLLALSFGLAEAQRRLKADAPQALQ